MHDKIKIKSTYDRDRSAYVYTGKLEVFSQLSISDEELRLAKDPRFIEEYVSSNIMAGIYNHIHKDTIDVLHRILSEAVLDYKSRSMIISEIRRLSGLTIPEEDI